MAQAKLLVSELVTNSVKYGANGSVRVEISHPQGGALHVEVMDNGKAFVAPPRDRPTSDVGGWGLPLVESVADRWGVHEGSARVWFELGAAT